MFRDQIHIKQQAANKRAQEDKTEPVLYNELVMDFRIRWNTTFQNVNQVLFLLGSIVNNVTFAPRNIDGVESQQALKIKLKLAFNQAEWNWLSALKTCT